jgi:hypothetical protein
MDNLGPTWGQIVSFTLHPFYFPWEEPQVRAEFKIVWDKA